MGVKTEPIPFKDNSAISKIEISALTQQFYS